MSEVRSETLAAERDLVEAQAGPEENLIGVGEQRHGRPRLAAGVGQEREGERTRQGGEDGEAELAAIGALPHQAAGHGRRRKGTERDGSEVLVVGSRGRRGIGRWCVLHPP